MPQSGLLVAGNIDMSKRPRVKNPDGTVSSIRSISIGQDGREVLIPTVTDDGRVVSNDEAVALYRKTGRHLGIFRDVPSANAHAKTLHESEAAKERLGAAMRPARQRTVDVEPPEILSAKENRELVERARRAGKPDKLLEGRLYGEGGIVAERLRRFGTDQENSDYKYEAANVSAYRKRHQDIHLPAERKVTDAERSAAERRGVRLPSERVSVGTAMRAPGAKKP